MGPWTSQASHLDRAGRPHRLIDTHDQYSPSEGPVKAHVVFVHGTSRHLSQSDPKVSPNTQLATTHTLPSLQQHLQAYTSRLLIKEDTERLLSTHHLRPQNTSLNGKRRGIKSKQAETANVDLRGRRTCVISSSSLRGSWSMLRVDLCSFTASVWWVLVLMD